MTKPFLQQLSEWIDRDDYSSLDACRSKVSECLRNWGRIHDQMEANKSSQDWEDSCFLAIHKEYKNLAKLVLSCSFYEDEMFYTRLKQKKKKVKT